MEFLWNAIREFWVSIFAPLGANALDTGVNLGAATSTIPNIFQFFGFYADPSVYANGFVTWDIFLADIFSLLTILAIVFFAIFVPVKLALFVLKVFRR